MINKLLELTTVATSSIANSKSIQELNEIKALYLGKKSPLSEIMSKMRELSVEEKKEVEEIYTIYHDELHGNGNGERYYKEIMALPESPEEMEVRRNVQYVIE